MKIAFIGDIVGRPGRRIIKDNLKKIRDEYNIDLVIANAENASHGFGLTTKNCDELLACGIDIITGGNHSFDKKKEMLNLLETRPVLRPDNYPEGVAGSGLRVLEVADEKIAIFNLMGVYGMPSTDNPFNHATKVIEKLHNDGITNIFIDFHAEVTSEKRIMMKMFEGQVSAICGTHTHVGTDDFEIDKGTFYVTDIGLTGCRDKVIGMDEKIPIQKATTGIGGHFDVANNCKSILQMAIIEIEEGKAVDAYKLKIFSDRESIKTQAIIN